MQTPPPLGRHPARQTTPKADTPQVDNTPSETATAADGTHPTGMHSCYHLLLDIAEFFRINTDIHFILQQLEHWSLKNNSTVIINGLFCYLLLIACYFWCGTMRNYISLLNFYFVKSTFIVFFLKNWRTSVHIVGPLIPLFWTFGDVYLGFWGLIGLISIISNCLLVWLTNSGNWASGECCTWGVGYRRG